MNVKPSCYVRNSEARIKSQPLENHPLQTSFAVANVQAITSAKFLLKVWQSHVFTAQFIRHCLINSHSSLFWLFLLHLAFYSTAPHSQWPCSNDQQKVSNSFCENPETSQFIIHPCPTLHQQGLKIAPFCLHFTVLVMLVVFKDTETTIPFPVYL